MNKQVLIARKGRRTRRPLRSSQPLITSLNNQVAVDSLLSDDKGNNDFRTAVNFDSGTAESLTRKHPYNLMLDENNNCINTTTWYATGKKYSVGSTSAMWNSPQKWGFVEVSQDNVQPGDIIVYHNGKRPHHSAMVEKNENGTIKVANPRGINYTWGSRTGGVSRTDLSELLKRTGDKVRFFRYNPNSSASRIHTKTAKQRLSNISKDYDYGISGFFKDVLGGIAGAGYTIGKTFGIFNQGGNINEKNYFNTNWTNTGKHLKKR